MRILGLFLIWIVGLSGMAQFGDPQRIIEKRIEFIGENAEEIDIDLTTYFDDFYYFLEFPLNLNEADAQDMIRLHILSDVQILSILNYRRSYDDFISIYELGAVEELDLLTIEMILPFVMVGKVNRDEFKWKNTLRYGKHEIITRYQNTFQEKEGYIEKSDSILALYPNRQYLGSSDQLYFRYRNNYIDRLSWGVTGEKDAGEQFFKGAQKNGFDFYSAHIFARKLWKFNTLAMGDYHVNFGQGLTIWSGFGIGKSTDIMSAKRYAAGLRPFTSANESRFLRGVGFSIQNDKFEFTGFGSRKKIDANVNEVDTLNDFFEASFTSFQISGYHRTPNEVAKKNVLQEQIIGGELAFRTNNFRIGVSSVYTVYNKLFKIDTATYKKFKFEGNQLATTGINYRYYMRKITFFGETALSDNLKLGTVNGMSWKVDPRLDLLMIYRNYDKAFHSIYSTGFGESSDNSGEIGVYIGAEAHITSKWSVQAYYDQFKFSYNKWLTDDLSSGREYFGQINFRATRNTNVYLRLRNKVTEKNTKDLVFGAKNQVDLIKNSVRFNYDQRINSLWSIKSRIEWVSFQYGDQINHGVLFFQDIKFKLRKLPLTIYGRYAIFDTDNYDTRIYAYENDLLGVFSIPSYFYKGIRTYLMLKYDLGRNIDFWLRWDMFSYGNADSISSGLEKINGREKSTIKIQLKIRI